MTDIQDCEMLERVMQEFAFIAEKLQHKYSKYVNITKHSKVWWNEECNKNLAKYYTSRRRTDWIKYKKSVKKTKKIFFDNKIQEIVLTNKEL